MMVASQKQLDALSRARAAKKSNPKEEQKARIDPEDLPEPKNSVKSGASMEDRGVWLDGLLAAIISLDIKHAIYMRDAIPIADEVLRAYKAKFK